MGVDEDVQSDPRALDVSATSRPVLLAIHTAAAFSPLAPAAGYPRKPARVPAPAAVVPIVVVAQFAPSSPVVESRISPVSARVHTSQAWEPDAAMTGKSTRPRSRLMRCADPHVRPASVLTLIHRTRRSDARGCR